MADILTDYEIQSIRRPKLFWLVFILYSATVSLTVILDIQVFLKVGLMEEILKKRSLFILFIIDMLQPFILFGFLRKSKISWCLIPLIQGMFCTIFLKKYYILLSIPNIPHLQIISENPESLFFCINSILIVALILQPTIINYFTISQKVSRIIIFLTLAIAFTILVFFYNKP